MNSAYYYEIQKKINSDRNNEGQKLEIQKNNYYLYNESTKPSTTAIDGEHILSDYEIINNDEIDDEDSSEEIVDLTLKKYENKKNIVEQTHSLNSSSVEPYKLRLNLNPTKIALKSQISKINKSILSPETTDDITTQIQNMKIPTKNLPISFKIEPLSSDECNKPPSNNDTNECNNLPEIILTSAEMRENILSTRNTMKKSATVTFQTIATTSILTSTTTTITSPSSAAIQRKTATKIPKKFSNISPIEISHHQKHMSVGTLNKKTALSPLHSPERNLRHQSHQFNSSSNVKSSKSSNSTTAIVEVHNIFRRDSEDSSEIHSLPGGGGSSTSPESIMDNILSAASSVSVCESSTNSSNSTATDITRLGVNIGADSPRMQTVGELDIRRCGGNDSGVTNSITQPIISSSPMQIEGANTSGGREIYINGSLNSNVKKAVSASPTLISTSLPIVSTTLASFRTPCAKTASAVVRTACESQWLQPPECFDTVSSLRSRSSSSAQSSLHINQENFSYPDDVICQICTEPLTDPRTLNCLHSFCFQCLVNENYKQDKSIPFWSQPNDGNQSTAIMNENNELNSALEKSNNNSFRSLSPETTARSFTETGSSPQLKQRRSSFSFRRKMSRDRNQLKAKSDGRTSEYSSVTRYTILPKEMDKKFQDESERIRFINCKICNYATDLPIGGLRQLPQNFMLTRRIEEIKLKAGENIISYVFCTLCFQETNATYHCVTCTLNLCTLCKEAHERQKNTSNHTIKNIIELRRSRKQQQTMLESLTKFSLKCGMHPGFEVKSFCNVCLQVACSDCLVLIHKGHKHETISKAIVNYSKLLNVSIEQARPLSIYAEHTVERLSAIAKDINKKCDEIQAAVEQFMQQYAEALEAHRKTLLQQVNRARETKIEILLEQQLDMEKRSNETLDAIRFCQDLRESASDVEFLSFVNILLKRFEYCQQFKSPIDPKISDSLHFLPKIVAPSTKEQNDITLYGIITMQIVEPALSTLQIESFSQFRLHKRVELTILTRDADGIPLCHGGMLKQIEAHLKYKDSNGKDLPIELSDNRDGTYIIAFTPDAQGTLILTISINDKPIKGSPFTLIARSVRPHSGIYHCCSFCSSGKSKGSKSTKCSCEGRMPGYNGCGHGHPGHPGRRHWSCCGSILENSECNVANRLLNS